MFFYMPVKLYTEENCVFKHKKELAALGKRAFLITGRSSSRKNGSLQDVEEALHTEGISTVIFDEIEENPSIETVMKAREQGLEAGVDFVVGIGGGSPMDAAKAIALMIRHFKEDSSYLYQAGSDSSALPVAAVPTTCGTGSETTPYAILTIHEKRTKASISHRIFPALALLDPRYLQTAPGHLINDTAVDALGHLVESFINTNATDYSRMCVLTGLSVWKKSRDIFLGKREAGIRDYENMLTASAMAGMAISHTGTSLPHGLSYYLTYEKGIPHGKAVGRFLPGYLREAAQEETSLILEKAGFSNPDDLERFYTAVCGQETEGAVSRKLKEEAISGILANPGKLKNCPYPVNEAVLQRIWG